MRTTTQRVRSLSMRSRTHRRRRAVICQNDTAFRGGNPTTADMNKLIDKLDLIINYMRIVHNASPDKRILDLIQSCDRAKMIYIGSRSPPTKFIHDSHVDALKDAARINREYKAQLLHQPPSQTSWMSQIDRLSKLPPRPPSSHRKIP